VSGPAGGVDVVVGAGHNGLIAACYLARAGRQVLVLEALDRPGGGSRTEEIDQLAPFRPTKALGRWRTDDDHGQPHRLHHPPPPHPHNTSPRPRTSLTTTRNLQP